MPHDAVLFPLGGAAWLVAVPIVKFACKVSAGNEVGPKIATMALGALIAAVTTPVASMLVGWKSRDEKVRGIAIMLGVAQMIDGVVHLFFPAFYSSNTQQATAASGNIFFGAGALGIASAFA